MDQQLHIRPLEETELDFFFQMFLAAFYAPEDPPAFDKSLFEKPEIRNYLENWGSMDLDRALIGTIAEQPVGCICGRIFFASNPGYGFVDEFTPELCIGLVKEYQGKGIGKQLMEAIFEVYKKAGVKQVSLSVEKDHPNALRLYKRIGFSILEDTDAGWTMIRQV